MIKREYEPLSLNTDLLNFLNNPKITLRAKGLLLYLLTQEDSFELNTKDLATYNKENASSLPKAINELESLGYIEVLNRNTPEMSYIIYDTPQISISTKFRDQEKLRRAANNATKNYIKTYLTPDKHFKRVQSIDSYLNDLQNPAFDVDWDYINDYINNWLTYDEFLRTEYWEIISIWKKIHSNFTCQNCGKRYNIMSKLNIHHKTYDTHGSEHCKEVLDSDLICWCEDCHKEWHIQNGLIIE